ncbi:hypothetical protein N7G274_004378 [Stereocaulon virgatum]|uniref:Uncharacterized protein n=1 Tax=Stereocaulon virgatum TaxID=373712 RepID=A0ABR4AD29_9LECA
MDHYSSSRSQRKQSPSHSSNHSSPSKRSPSATAKPTSSRSFAAIANSSQPYESPYAQNRDRTSQPPSDTSYRTSSRSESDHPTLSVPSPLSTSRSPYSSSSDGSLYRSTPAPQQYSRNTLGKMSNSRTMSANDKEQLLRSLRTHRVNTLTELRRIEKLFASDNSRDVTEAMTSAWAHYVNSNNLLSELRGMTKNYPFSSECLDDAKWQVIGDEASVRSWNYCWLILTKIKNEGLIKKHAQQLAVKPAMWGGRNPPPSSVEKLANACQIEWTRALDHMLRQWATPPSTSVRNDIPVAEL